LLGPAFETFISYVFAISAIVFAIAYPTRKLWMRTIRRKWLRVCDLDRIEMEQIRDTKEHKKAAEAEIDSLLGKCAQPEPEQQVQAGLSNGEETK